MYCVMVMDWSCALVDFVCAFKAAEPRLSKGCCCSFLSSLLLTFVVAHRLHPIGGAPRSLCSSLNAT
jgi:hypothetical protein